MMSSKAPKTLAGRPNRRGWQARFPAVACRVPNDIKKGLGFRRLGPCRLRVSGLGFRVQKAHRRPCRLRVSNPNTALHCLLQALI